MTEPPSGPGPVGASPVWMYWEDAPGRSLPAYLSLCRDTVRAHLSPDQDLHVLDRTSALAWLPDLDEEVWNRLQSPVQRSDYVRTRLVYRYGGLWIDADCIAVAELGTLRSYLDQRDLASWGWDVRRRFFNNLFLARPGAEMLARWIESQDRILRDAADWSTLSWSALGTDATHPFLARMVYANMPAPIVSPVLWYEWRRFLSPFQSPRRVLASDPVTVMLWNKGMGPALARYRESDLLESTMLLSRLFRVALGRTTLEQEMDIRTMLAPLSNLRHGAKGQALERRIRRRRSAAPR